MVFTHVNRRDSFSNFMRAVPFQHVYLIMGRAVFITCHTIVTMRIWRYEILDKSK